MTNLVNEKCPKCGNLQCDILGMIRIKNDENIPDVNVFLCKKCRTQHRTERTPEQIELVKKYITDKNKETP